MKRSRLRPAVVCAGVFALVIGSAFAQDPATAQPEQPAEQPAQEQPAAAPKQAPAKEYSVLTGQGEGAEGVGTIAVNPPASAEEQSAAGGSGSAAEGAVELDQIEVTGSRIKRADFETAQPVFSIGREDIDRSGLTSIGDLLQDMSQAGSALNTAVNNGGNGSVEVDLRNLGSNRVLVLVNGRRWVNGLRSSASSAVDLNTIPISVIERVEVLKDGASAVYGSDAIAGVVNIITRKNYQGAEIRTQFGMFLEEGDGFVQSSNVALGSITGNTSAFVDIGYTKQDEVWAGDRDISKVPTFGTGISRGSSSTPQGRFVFTPQGTPSPACLDTDEDGTADLCNLTLTRGEDGAEPTDFENFVGSVHRYNFAPLNYLLTPNERSSIFTAVNHRFSPDLQFQGEFLYNLRKSAQLLAETPLSGIGDGGSPPWNTLYVAADNPYNPFNQDIGNPADGNGDVIFRRMTELGPRIFRQDVDTIRLGGGLKGELDLFARLFSWDVGYTWAQSRNQDRSDGLVNLDRLRLALGPLANCTATPGCVPFNIFGGQGTTGTGSITPEMLNYVSYIGQGAQQQNLKHLYAYLSHDLVDLWAGPVAAAWGLEVRDEFFADTPDPLIQTSASSTNRALPTSGGYNVREVYAEFNVPLLRDAFLTESLEASLAGRFSDYNVFGSDTNYKLGLRWKVFADLLVRGTASTAFRAPSVSELYLGLSDSFPAVGDPCTDYTGAGGGDPAPQTVQDNCAADGVPADYQQTNFQILERLGGNANLQPEEAETLTFGVVYSPGFLPDFNVYLDWYSIDLENAITTLGSQPILDLCYNSPDRNPSCALIDRNENTGSVNEIINTFVNIGGTKVTGIDITADYVLPWLKEFGSFKLQMDTAYLIDFTALLPGPGNSLIEEERSGTNRSGDIGSAYPHLKMNFDVIWALGAWKADYGLRFISAQSESCEDGGVPSLASFGLCSQPDASFDGEIAARNELDSVLYHDLQVGYTLPGWDIDITGGITNLWDEDPPISFSAFANSFDVATYDVPGRFGYLRLGKRF